MTPYLYAPIQFKPHVDADRVTVGVLVAGLEDGHVELATAPIGRLTRGPRQSVEAAREAVEDIAACAHHLRGALQGMRHPSLLAWWRARAAHREDFVRLGAPLPGAADDLRAEAHRILHRITGLRPSAPRTSRAQSTIRQVLTSAELRDAFGPALVQAGAVQLHYARLHRGADRMLAVEAFDLEREHLPERVVFRAGRELTKSEILRRADVRLRPVVVAVAPREGKLAPAWREARALLDDAGARVVSPDAAELRRVLVEEGVDSAA